jgi:hypothetical protein
MTKPERKKRVRKAIKVVIPTANDGTNTPVPSPNATAPLTDGEKDLYKQAENPLGDPHKI